MDKFLIMYILFFIFQFSNTVHMNIRTFIRKGFISFLIHPDDYLIISYKEKLKLLILISIRYIIK